MSARDERLAGRRERALTEGAGPETERRPRAVAPPPPPPPRAAASLRASLRGRGALRRAMLLQAVLGPPKAFAEDDRA